jgi:glycosyltransferase involved in cell wall biosynthesis
MKISIITPTHDTRFLRELEESILANSYPDWEWIVLKNGAGCGVRGVGEDPRIKVFDCPFESESIGRLKKYACSLATGEVIAEVDHDDMITPDCLEELSKAFGDPETGFVYSDNAKLPMKERFVPYRAEYGWTYRTFKWKGKNLYAMRSLPLDPERLGHIWFAPDHIRAWRKDIYDSIGGHNEDLAVCDDLDLMHRLYLVTKFLFIPKVLYIYRITGGNTWLKKCDLIEQEDKRLYDKNISSLTERFAQINNV